MKSAKVLVLALLFLFSGVLPLTNVEAADEERRDTDTNYLSEAWRSGLGTSIGSLNSIKSRDIDNDEVWKLMLANVRTPRHNYGDLRAMIGAVDLGEKRIIELINKYGKETFNDIVIK